MRIGFVSHEVGGVRGGGIGTYVVEAGRALAAAGHEVWLVTEDGGLDAAQRTALDRLEGFHRVVRLEARAGPRWFHANAAYGHAMRVHEALLRCAVDFDYLEFADYRAEGLIALREQRLFRSYGTTVMAVNLHSPSYECYRWNERLHLAGEDAWEVFALEEQAIRDAPFLNAPSTAIRDVVCARLGLPSDGVAIVPYPMAAGAAEPSRAPARLEDVRFLFLGRIEPRKGIDVVLDAFRRMPQLRLRVAGGDTPFSPLGGSLREWLERSAPPNVAFLGPLPPAEVQAELRHADVCVLPSRFENWPNACLEAMLAGRVVIGSRHGGMAQMIEPGRSGFLVDGRDPEELVRVVEQELAPRLAELPEIGARATSRARELSDPRRYAEAIARRVAAARGRIAATVARPSTKVSVVVPFHSDRATLDAAVDSALAQDHRDLEILVVNDGSPLPDAPELLERQRKKDPRVRVLDKPNGGLSSARNHGVAHATGELVLFLDADNVLCPDYARTAAGVLAGEPGLDFVVPHVRFVRLESGVEHGIYNPLPFRRELALGMNRFGDAGACFRRRVFAELGVRYDERLRSFEDWALWLDLDRAGVRGIAIPRVLYHYRERSDSMVRRFGWSGLHASVGLLIASHLHVPDDAARDRLFGLLQTWGRGAHDHEVARRADDPAHDGELAALRERLDAAYRDHAGTMAHRDALERRCAELTAERAAADAGVRALREELARAHADHAGTLRHRDALEAECRSLRARRQATTFLRWFLGGSDARP
jgi:glycosyltransferase involved in cell wall biosynthesis